MITYNLLNEPNQRFSVSLNGHDVELRFRTFRGIIYIDVSIDDNAKVGSIKAVPNVFLLPAEMRRMIGGQFIFICEYGDYPRYDILNTPECTFAYVSSEEMNV